MRHILPFAVILLGTSAALADGPVVIGSGTSSQSVDLAGGAVSVGVESGGSADTGTGEGSGHLVLSVDVPGGEVSGGVAEPAAGDATTRPSEPARRGSSGLARGGADCAADGRPLSIAQLEALHPAGMRVVESCGGVDLGPEGRRAVASNAELIRHLSAHGVPVSEVTGLAISADGARLLVTRAYVHAAD